MSAKLIVKCLLLLFCVTFFYLYSTGCPKVNAVQELDEKKEDKWTLVWEQTFDSDEVEENKTSFDRTIWTKIPRGTPDWQRHMSSFDSCYAFRNGCMVLRGITNTTQYNDPSSYLTGGWYTKGKKTFGFGRLEIRAKLQASQGAWPAIWMMPAANVAWPLGGEIDIMERINYEKRVHQTVHSYYTKNIGNKTNPQATQITPMNLDDTFNVYTLEKYQDSLVFYINDQKVHTYPRVKNLNADQRQYPFSDSEFYLILSMQLGGNWAGEISASDLPNEMEIDWIRFYEARGEEASTELNPNKQKLPFEFKQSGNVLTLSGIHAEFQADVVDMKSCVVHSKKAIDNTTINLESKGIYVVRVITEHSNTSVKVVL